MKKDFIIREIHRLVALVVGLQLLFWSIGGLFFSLIPIDEIHGDHLVNRSAKFEHNGQSCLSPMQALELAIDDYKAIPNLILIKDDVVVPYIRFAKKDYYSLCDGSPLKLIEEAEVRKIASKYADSAGEIAGVEFIESVAKDSEYRGKPLPAFQVRFSGDESLNLYLHPRTGEVITARTDNWRVFDFLWMLHIMDYEARDNFNHILLQIAALLAVLTSITGLVLWWISGKRRK